MWLVRRRRLKANLARRWLTGESRLGRRVCFDCHPGYRDGVLYRAVSGQLENLTRLSMIRYCRLNGWGVMKICVPIGGRSCSCGAVRAGGRLATVRWCRLHWSSTTAAQNQTPAALPLCQVSPLRHYYTIITSLLHHYYVIITKGENA